MEITAPKIRQFLQAHGKEMTLSQIYKHFGISDLTGRDKIFNALRNLKDTGCVIRTASETYKYVRPSVRLPITQAKIYKAVLTLNLFTPGSIRNLTSASPGYVYTYLLFLMREGYIEKIQSGDQKTQIYQKTEKATPDAKPLFSRVPGSARSQADTIVSL